MNEKQEIITNAAPAKVNQMAVREVPPPLKTSDTGLLVGSTLEEQFRIATAYLRSNMFPSAFDSAEKIMVALQFARELGLPAITACRQICIINQTPSLWGDLPLALVKRSGLLEGIQEWWFTEDGTVISAENENERAEAFGATCVVARKGEHGQCRRTFTLADAKRANLIDKSRSVWRVYPRRMLQCRARAWALKDTFPDCLNGAAIAEHDFDVMPGEQDGGHQEKPRTPNTSINGRFGAPPADLLGAAGDDGKGH